MKSPKYGNTEDNAERLVSKHYKIPIQYLCRIRPQTLDGIYKFVNIQTGYVYNYDSFNKRFYKGIETYMY